MFQLSRSLQPISMNADWRRRARSLPPSIAEHVSSERLELFFSQEGKGFQVKREIREICISQPIVHQRSAVFASGSDLLPNVMIYLGPALQRDIIPLFPLRTPSWWLSLSWSLGEYYSSSGNVPHDRQEKPDFQRKRLCFVRRSGFRRQPEWANTVWPKIF